MNPPMDPPMDPPTDPPTDPIDPNHETRMRQVFIKKEYGPEILHRDQIRAINVMRGQSKCDSCDATPKLVKKIETALTKINNLTAHPYELITKYIASSAPITINVAPHIVKILLDDHIYRSTFEVNAPKGPQYLTARTAWESACFLGLYDGVKPYSRVKYGALNYLNCPQGVISARSYGAWHFTLKDTVRKRCTLATGDTGCSRTLGVLDFCDHVLVEFTECDLVSLTDIAAGTVAHADPKSYNNGYREIQIHGELSCERDIASLHIPANNDHRTKNIAVEFSEKYNIPIVYYDE